MAKEIVVFKTDDRVSHDLFGEGFVKEVTRSQNGHDAHLYIEFDEPHQRFEGSPSTRFRKILSSYIQKLECASTTDEEKELVDKD